MRKTILIAILIFLFFYFQKVNAQQQQMYTFCTGSSYGYLLDTSAASTSSYFARWNIGTTGYTAHFQNDTIYQGSGSGSGTGGYGSVKKWACTGTSTATTVWTYTASYMHHDLCPMPNGNVLVLVRETKTSAQVTQAGGSSAISISSDIIREIKPTGATTGTVVWEWKLWDHLCQNYNASKDNYVSSISANPQLWNINCNLTPDGFHPNGLDYNPTLDQIVFSSHNNEEIFVLDHSTTTAQAATHLGGNSGKGGDFLYRWGKPQNYGCTSNGNGVTLNTIHDVRWVSSTNLKWPNYISFFHNNGGGAVQAVLHLPPYNGYNYSYTPGSVIGPTSAVLPAVPNITNVPSMGGCMACDNGNIVITKPNTAFYETNGISPTSLQTVSVGTVQADRLKKCDVISPIPTASATASTACVNNTITLNSSAIAPLQTSPSYTYSWSSIPSGFTSSSQNPTVTPTTAGTYTYIVTITSGGCSSTASLNVIVSPCTEIEETPEEKITLNIYPNPTTGLINLNEEFVLSNNFEAIVCNSYGEVIVSVKNSSNINLSEYANGIYYLILKSENGSVENKKIVLIK